MKRHWVVLLLALVFLLSHRAALAPLVPQHRQYALLKEALRRERSAPQPNADRVRKIELNLERWRWLPESFGERYIVVDVPTFTLSAVDGGRSLAMRVVAGEKENPTPIFSDQMTTVVFSPYWNIPATIAQKAQPGSPVTPSILPSVHPATTTAIHDRHARPPSTIGAIRCATTCCGPDPPPSLAAP